MSLEQHAFLTRGSVPSRADWQAAIVRLGFDLQIYPGLKPFEDSGFLPCKLGAKDSGFEIYYDPADELLTAYPQMKEKVGHRDYCISFRWGGDMAECACVLIASAALAKSFDAVVYYPDDDLIYSLDALVSDAKEALEDS
jgi:hypothetical protein